MACGKPVIVSRSGGAAELFTDNYDAVGVQPGDSSALASAIQHLIDNPDLCKRLSENARNTVLSALVTTI
jgi:glycosyltransferase involved in cell wall biosynthesis